MQNIKIPQRVGNSIAKYAYIQLIADSMAKLSVCRLEMDGYDNNADRVHFQYGGRKCTLYGVWMPNFYDNEKPATITLQVKARTNYGTSAMFDLPIDIRDFRFKTLDRIAYEVYDYCKGENDDDYETAIKEYIADGMDRYREFMS
jgi:hypothetical protein